MLIAMLADAATKEAGAKPFPPFETWHMPSQIFWLVIFFTFLYFALSRFIIPRLSDTIERRGNTIANDIDEAAKLNDQAVEAQQALELKLAQAKAKARESAEATKAKIDAEIATQTARVDEEIDAKLEDAEVKIAEMRSKAMANVESIATEAASAITSRFNISPDASAVKTAVSSALN